MILSQDTKTFEKKHEMPILKHSQYINKLVRIKTQNILPPPHKNKHL